MDEVFFDSYYILEVLDVYGYYEYHEYGSKTTRSLYDAMHYNTYEEANYMGLNLVECFTKFVNYRVNCVKVSIIYESEDEQ